MFRSRCFLATMLSLTVALLAAGLQPSTVHAQSKEKGWGSQHDRSVQIG